MVMTPEETTSPKPCRSPGHAVGHRPALARAGWGRLDVHVTHPVPWYGFLEA